jgi:predicted Fe-Mo cluster-binding NifX family protein
VLVAIPNSKGRVSPVLDVAARLLVVQVKDGREIARQETDLPENRPDKLAGQLADLGVKVLICGAISQPLVCWLASVGVKVLPHICGDAEKVLKAYLKNMLNQPEFRMPGCDEGHCGWHLGPKRFRSKKATVIQTF